MSLREFIGREAPTAAANRHVSTISPCGTRARRAATREQLGAQFDALPRLAERLHRAEAELSSLRMAVQARDAFLAVASHELRNPMGAIALGVSNLLFQAQRADAIPPWVRERLEALERQTRHFVRRSTTLLDISRLAAGSFRIDREPTNLTVVVRDVLRDLGPEAASARCELQPSIEDDVIGPWDRAALAQVAHSFLSNAITYGAGQPIDVFLRRDRSMVAIGVRDRGPGISQADRERIFSSFAEAIGAHERAGFGLGLWVARQLAVAHDGELFVESEPGVGSVFAVVIPCEAPPTHP
jgi:two-component system OmpR family sensor kinase